MNAINESYGERIAELVDEIDCCLAAQAKRHAYGSKEIAAIEQATRKLIEFVDSIEPITESTS